MIITILSAILFSGWATPAASLAAPPALPPCGDNTVGGSTNSGPPDIGQSANGQYTAVVWTEGTSGSGPVNLAYSEALTSLQNLDWRLTTGTNGEIVSGSNATPRLDFEPGNNSRVHVVYVSFSNSGLGYARCALGGACDIIIPKLTGTTSFSSLPQIAATPLGVVIVYEEAGSIKLIHFAHGGTSAAPITISSGSSNDQPALAYSDNGTVTGADDRIHVVYKSSTGLKYGYYPAANVGGAWGAVTLASIGADPDADARRPAIAALGSTVMIVWDRLRLPVSGEANLSKFRVFQNFSRDNGTTWNGQARSIPAHKAVGDSEDVTINDDLWVSYDQDAVNSFPRFLGLQPDVFFSEYLGQPYAHVVWHAQMSQTYQNILLPGQTTPDRGDPLNISDDGHDILYAYAPLGSTSATPPNPGWTGIPMGNNGIIEPVFGGGIDPNGRIGPTVAYSSTHGLTDLTAWHFFNSFMQNTSTSSGRDTLQPHLSFLGNDYDFTAGNQFNRLQVVYLSQDEIDSKIYQVRYNGFELGRGNFNATPNLNFQDSDCDSIPDAVEIARSADNDETNPAPFCTFTTANTYKEMNCDLNSTSGDYLPDFMDTDADGDGTPDITDTEWRTDWRATACADGKCIFLPVVLKK